MSSPAELDGDLRALYAVDVDEQRYERALARALRVVDDEIAATRTRSRRTPVLAGLPRMTPRALLIMVLVLVLLVAVAVAQPAIRRIVFGEPDRPANRVESFQEAEPAVQLASFEDPAADPIEAGLALELANAANLPIDDPDGWGRPLADYARLLLDREVAGVRVRVAAAPTSRGYLCYVQHVGPLTTGACLSRLDAEQPARFGTASESGRTMVVGLLADGVQGVTIELEDGTVAHATLEPNAFAWVGRGARPAGVVVTMEDGREVRFAPSGALR